MRNITTTILVVAALFSTTLSAPLYADILIDSVIATVDDKPITLLELGKRMTPPRQLSLSDISSDATVQKTLDALILEKLLLAEAERKNIKILDDDISRYIEEVKLKNQLSDAQFEEALKKENQTLASYKERIKTEILKSRVATASIKSTAAVTEDEVTQYIRQKLGGELPQATGQKVHLRRILLSATRFTAEEARKKSEDIAKQLEEGESFEALATRMSDAPDASNGGDLGTIPTSDLSPEIVDAVSSLQQEQTSHLVTSPAGFEIFQLVERIDSSESDQEEADETLQKRVDEVPADIRAQVKQKLEAEKMEKKMTSFIDQELPKLHTIEKKFK